jgi:predicted metal-dependent HD superfamily phosphohydrolase
MWRQLGASGADEELFRKLVACYSEPHRKYHTVQHLNECFAHLESVHSFAERSGEIEWALWFHDAIYDTRRADNEERSAEWARDSALTAGLSSDQASRIYQLVMATKHDAISAAGDAAILVDIDLAILGSDEPRFDEYEAQVREEYAFVPEPLYRKGRRTILQQFVSRQSIYCTEYFQINYEARARNNIARSLARL